MNQEKQLNQLYKAAREQKETIMKELGAIDFHFQIPNFDSPLRMITSILTEISEFAYGMQEFNKEKLSESDSPVKAIRAAVDAEMWGIWNSWNSVIGMILTSEDPKTMSDFHDMMKDFAEQRIIDPLKKEGGN